MPSKFTSFNTADNTHKKFIVEQLKQFVKDHGADHYYVKVEEDKRSITGCYIKENLTNIPTSDVALTFLDKFGDYFDCYINTTEYVEKLRNVYKVFQIDAEYINSKMAPILFPKGKGTAAPIPLRGVPSFFATLPSAKPVVIHFGAKPAVPCPVSHVRR